MGSYTRVYCAIGKRNYLEPINGAAVDQGGEFPQAGTECVTNWTHCENNVKLIANTFNKEIE